MTGTAPPASRPARPSARRHRLPALALAGLLAGAMAVAAFRWWSGREPTAAPLDRAWTATVHVLAGDGVLGARDGDRARFADPFGLAVDRDGTVLVADGGDRPRIRGIDSRGYVFTRAGSTRGFRDGAALDAQFDTPSGIAIGDDGTIYVADTGNHAIRRITADGQVTTLAGDGVAGDSDGPGARARFDGPIGLALDPAGRLFVADTYNDRIRAIERDGTVRTVAGSRPGDRDGAAADARFLTPTGLAVARDGTLYVADTGNGRVRRIDAAGRVSTPDWSPLQGAMRPLAVAPGAGGELFVTDERGRIVELAADGSSRTIAGSHPGFLDGAGAVALFRRPAGIAVLGPGRLVVADAGNALVRLVAAPSQLGLRPPSSPAIRPAFDVDRFALEPLLWPVAPMAEAHEVAGTMGEARGGDGAERFHAGVDVREPEGTPVLAVRDGVVLSPAATADFGTINESVHIGPLGYVHVRVGRDRRGGLLDETRFAPVRDDQGRLTAIRARRGARFRAGDTIGTINPFNHVHLNVGWPGEEYNPLAFRLPTFEDTIAPTIARGGIRLFDENGRTLTTRQGGRLLVAGRVQIVVDAWDQADGNRPDRRLGLFAVGYQVLRADGTPAAGFDEPITTLRFDQLSPAPDAARLVYASGSGIPYFGQRRTRFLYVVTNAMSAGVASSGTWDTSSLPPGDYTLRIHATDVRGNQAIAGRDVLVRITAPGEAVP